MIKFFKKTLLCVVALIMCIMSVRIDVLATEANTLFSPTLMYTLDKVNVRSGPGTDFDIIGELESGSSIFAKGLEDGWYKVIYADSEGYIRQDFLAFYGESNTSLTEEMQQSGETALEEFVEFEQEQERIEAEISAAEEAERLQAEAEEAEAKRKAEEQALAEAKGKRNNIIIIIGVVAIIIIYSALQIIKGKDEKDDEDIDEYDEYDEYDDGNYEDYDEEIYEEVSEDEAVDLDEAFTPEELSQLSESNLELDDEQVEFIDLSEMDEPDEFEE